MGLLPVHQSLLDGAVTLFRSAVPRPEDRIPIASNTWPYLFSPAPPLLVMAYLVRRPNTHMLRVFLFPLALFASLRAGYGYALRDPYDSYNVAFAFIAWVNVSRAIEFAFMADVIKKVDETVPRSRGSTTPSSSQATSPSSTLLSRILPESLLDASELLFSLRGIGFDYGQGVPIPQDDRPMEPWRFIWATFRAFMNSFLLIDFMEALTYKFALYFPHARNCTVYDPSLPWHMRYALSTTFAFIAACRITMFFDIWYSICTLFGVLVLSQSPKSWPPIFDKPLDTTSLHEFWAKRWHQLMRRTFLYCGGFLGGRIGEYIGGARLGGTMMRIAVFFTSGLIHSFSVYAMGQGIGWRIPLCFFTQGLLISCEHFWRRMTGRRVIGWAGRLWTVSVLLIVGPPCLDACLRRGFGCRGAIPTSLSVSRRVLFPGLDIP